MISSSNREFKRLHEVVTSSERGVSLVELMTVLVIIAILSLAVLYGAAGYESFRDRVAVRGFQSSVLTKMREAKNVAKAANKNAYLYFDLDNEKCWIEIDSKVHGSVLSPASPRAELKGFEDAANNTVLWSGVQCLIFNARGSCLADGDWTVSTTTNVLHFGYKDALYAVGQPSGNYRSIVVLTVSSRAEMFDVGCFDDDDLVTAWSWPDCTTL